MTRRCVVFHVYQARRFCLFSSANFFDDLRSAGRCLDPLYSLSIVINYVFKFAVLKTDFYYLKHFETVQQTTFLRTTSKKYGCSVEISMKKHKSLNNGLQKSHLNKVGSISRNILAEPITQQNSRKG